MTEIDERILGERTRSRIWGYTKEEIEALPAIIGPEEVSHIAVVSVRTVTREAEKGNIAGAFRFGSQWRFNTDVVCEQCGRAR